MIKKVLILLLVVLPARIYAQRTYHLDTVTISATRLPVNLSETGRNISVISGAEIHSLPVKTLDELLRYIPGVEVQSRNAFGVQADITIRGSTFTQVLVLIDGMRISDPLTGHFNNYIPVAINEISRIEILKGPAASLYGADAVGGVIHIITKTFDEEISHAPEVDADFGVGQHGLIMANAGGFMSQETIRAAAGIVSTSAEGHPLPSGDNADFNIHTGSFSIRKNLENDWNLSARTGIDYRDFNAKFFYTRSPFDESRETTSSMWTQARVSRQFTDMWTSIDAAYKRTNDRFVFNPAFPSTNEHTTQLLNLQWNNRFFISDHLTLAPGIQFDNRNIQSNDRGDHNDWHGGIYVVGNYTDNTSLNINGSLRWDYDENYGSELVPQLNISYQLSKLVLRGSAGRSIRAADFTERFISTNLPGPLSPGRNIGNPELNAESSWSWEGGLDFYLTPGVKLLGTYFQRSSKELIDYVITNADQIPDNSNLMAGEEYFYAQNIEAVNTNGFEIELWGINPVGENLDLRYNAGYLFLNANNESGQISKYISNHARHLFTGNGVLTGNRWEFGLNVLYKQRDPDTAEAINANLSKEYWVWNSKISVMAIKNTWLYLQAHNLFDANYSDILGAQMPGRWIMGGFRFNIEP